MIVDIGKPCKVCGCTSRYTRKDGRISHCIRFHKHPSAHIQPAIKRRPDSIIRADLARQLEAIVQRWNDVFDVDRNG